MLYKSSITITKTTILAARIIRQVVQGLLYLHSHQILHRDMSLSNLLLTRDMQVVYKYIYICTYILIFWRKIFFLLDLVCF